MRRVNLLGLQILVAIASVGIWYVFSTYPVFGHVLLPLHAAAYTGIVDALLHREIDFDCSRTH